MSRVFANFLTKIRYHFPFGDKKIFTLVFYTKTQPFIHKKRLYHVAKPFGVSISHHAHAYTYANPLISVALDALVKA